MDNAERAALNIKFEYEKAKRLRAAEAQAKGINTPSNLLPGQAQMLNQTPYQHGYIDLRQEPMVKLVDVPEPSPSIPKLIAKLTLRIVLVIAVAVTVLAVIS